MSTELRNGIGRFSKVLEASEERRAVMDLEIRWRDLQVRDMLASSDGVSHGRTSSAHSRRDLGLSFSSRLCRLLGGRYLLGDGCWYITDSQKLIPVLNIVFVLILEGFGFEGLRSGEGKDDMAPLVFGFIIDWYSVLINWWCPKICRNTTVGVIRCSFRVFFKYGLR